MAPRLAVVVSQAPMRDARTADIEESIVAELIMVGGLDATLVGPLERIQPDSTDRLCLGGFTQDLALLSWMSAAEAVKCWSDLGLSGSIIPMSLDGSAPSNGATNGSVHGQRVFYIQLTNASVPSQVCKQLRSRLDLMRVQPVSLQLSLKSPTKSNPATASQGTQMPIVPPSNVSAPTAKPSVSPAITPVQPFDLNAKVQSNSSDDSDAEWKNLDSLVDELDALDL